MKSPTNYGSENEETRFIRRVAAPDRPSNKRRQKKRLAIAGATLGLLAASAGVGYATMKNAGSTSAVQTAKLESNMANEAFVSKLGDAFHPNFNKIDKNDDGVLSKDEILADLNEKEMVDVEKVKASDLPADIKKNVLALLEEKLKSDGDCASQASDQREIPVTKKDHEIFYYLLDVFCPRVTIAVTPPDQEEETEAISDTSQQQTVEIPTPDGETAEVVIVGEPIDGKQTIAIPDGDGGYTTTEVRSIQTPTGEQKILIPNAEGDITPVVVPQVPEEVAAETAEDTQVVDVVTPSGETEQVIIEGEPEHGKQTVEIPDNDGGYTETTAKVVETASGEEKLIVQITDGDVIAVPVPEPIAEYTEPQAEEPVQQTVEVTTSTGETQQVTIIGEPEHGEQTVQIVDEHGEMSVEQVKVIETASGDIKLDLPDVEGLVTVPEVPEEVTAQAELTGEQPQVVDVVTPEGETEQIIVVGEPEHGEQTVEIVDEHGETTTEEVRVVETSTGEQKLIIPELEEPVVVPEPVAEYTEPQAEEPVQQTVEVTTSTGETQQVTIIGEPEHGEQTVQIVDEHGETSVEQVKVLETASGDIKLDLPDVEGLVTVPEVPEEVTAQAELTGEQPQVVDVVTPEGETEQIIVVGEPEHGEQTVEIVDEHGETTTEEVRVVETSTGEQKLIIPELEEPVVVPEPVAEYTEPQAEEPVQQTVEVTTSTGETQQVTIIGEPEHGEQTVQIVDEHGETSVEQVKVIETASGDIKLDLPDVEGLVTVPEVPEEVTAQAELTGEQPQVVDVVTPEGETEQIIVVGEPEHGEQTVEIVDEHGETTTEEVRVVETSTGEQELIIPELEEPVLVPEPVIEEVGGNWWNIPPEYRTGEHAQPIPIPDYYEPQAEEPVQQTVEVTTSTGETQQVTIIGEPEHGEQTVQIVDEHGETSVEQVKVIETASGDIKLDLPDVEGLVTVPEVPEEVTAQAELTGEQPQVVDVVTPEGETEQIIVVGEPEHGEQTVEIVDEHGETTTEEVRVVETSTGEQKLIIPELEEPVVVPEPVAEYTEPQAEEPVQQTVEVTTSTGETQQVTIIGEPEHGEQTVQIVDEHGETSVEQVKVIETASGDIKLDLPDVEGLVTVPEVPEEVTAQAELTGEQPQVVDVVTPEGETEQIIVVGEPEHGEQTVEIVDEHGETTTEEVRVVETSTGEQKLIIPELEEPVVVPEPVAEYTEPQAEEPVQQTVEVTTSTGETQQVTIIGEPEHGEQTVQIVDEHGETSVEQVKVIETASGDIKLDLPDVEGLVTVPEVPEEVTAQAELTGEQPQVVDVVTPEGETEQIIVVGEPEHGEQTVEIVDEHGETTTEEVRVVETSTGEQKLIIPELEEPVVVPEPVAEYTEPQAEEPVQQTVEVTTSTGETQQVTIIGEPEHGEQTVQIVDEHGETSVEQVKVIETASGDIKLDLPDVEGLVTVPEVPEEVTAQAELTGEQPQVVDVVTPEGETEQIIVVGEPEHGEQTVEIVDEHGETTTEEVRVVETSTGEQELIIPELEEPVLVPEPVIEEVGGNWWNIPPEYRTGEHAQPIPIPDYYEPQAEEPVQQTVEVTTSTGETQQVTIIGEPEHGEQTVQIVDEHGETSVEQVKVIETASGDIKLDLPDVEGLVTVPEVPEEVTAQAELTGEQPQVVDVVTPEGETEQIIVVGEPEHGEQTVEIVDEHGETTTEEVRVVETSTGEQKLIIPELEEPVVVPEPVIEEVGGNWWNIPPEYRTGEHAQPIPIPDYYEPQAEEPVQQTVEVTTSTGETQQVTIIGEPEHGEQTVQIVDEHGETSVEQVKVIETASGDIKLDLPDVEGLVTVPEVPEEVTAQAELTGEQPQVVDVVTPEGETEQIIVVGEPEHGEQTVEIVDEHGETTTEEVRVVETSTGEQKLIIPELEEPVVVPEPVAEYTEPQAEEPVQQTVEVTTSTGETQQVTIIGEPEHGEQTVQIVDEHGETSVEQVKVLETASGDIKLDLPDVEGLVTVPEVPEEVTAQAELTGEQPQVVDVVTPEGETEQIIVVGEPEHGEQTVEIVDEHGETTTEEVRVVETSTGEQKLIIPELEEPVTVPEPIEEEPGNLMTKVEFRDWIAKHYEDKISELQAMEKQLAKEEKEKASRVQVLSDCIEQAANKFGYYGVYEQPPHFQNAVDWVQNECWVADRWEPEPPMEHRMLRR